MNFNNFNVFFTLFFLSSFWGVFLLGEVFFGSVGGKGGTLGYREITLEQKIKMANVSGIVKSARKIMRQDTGTGSDELRILQLGWMLFLKIFSDKDKELELLDDNYTSPIPAELHWDEWAGDDEGMTGDELLQFVDRKLFPTLSEIDLSSGNRRAVLVHEVFANNYNYHEVRHSPAAGDQQVERNRLQQQQRPAPVRPEFMKPS